MRDPYDNRPDPYRTLRFDSEGAIADVEGHYLNEIASLSASKTELQAAKDLLTNTKSRLAYDLFCYAVKASDSMVSVQQENLSGSQEECHIPLDIPFNAVDWLDIPELLSKMPALQEPVPADALEVLNQYLEDSLPTPNF